MSVSRVQNNTDSGCSRCCTQFKDTVNVGFKTMLEGETVNKTAKLATVSIKLKDAIKPASEGWQNLYVALKGCIAWLDVIEIINRIREWVVGEVKGFWKVLSRICLTIAQTINVMNFLDMVKLINFKGMLESMSRVPVLGDIIALPGALLGLGAYLFSMIHNSVKVRRDSAETSKNVAKREACEVKLRALAIMEHSPESWDTESVKLEHAYIDARKIIEAAKAKKGETVTSASSLANKIKNKWDAFITAAEEGDKAKIRAYNQALIQRHSVKEYNANLDKSKSRLSIIRDVSKVLLYSLGLLGLAVGGLLAVTSIPMLALAAVSAAIGVFKVFYDKRRPKEVPTLPAVVAPPSVIKATANTVVKGATAVFKGANSVVKQAQQLALGVDG